MVETNTDQFLNIKNVSTAFKINGQYYDAVSNVNLEVKHDEILAIVGESGCGKSTLATTIMGLHDPEETKISGEIDFEGTDLLKLDEKGYNKVRGAKIGMIFQDPLSALNPLKRIEDQIQEVMVYHTKMTEKERHARVIELLNQVGIEDPDRTAHQFPHQLSGGMRQRIIIAIAIACKPDLIIADEPTTALDVTIQAQILDVLRDIQRENHAGIILITHDLGVVAETADRVAVMYAGQIVEQGTASQIFNEPKHPYTRSLLRSMPQRDNESDDLYVIQGMVPSLQKMPKQGDRFAPRIPWIPASAHETEPKMHDIGDNHLVRCTCYKDFYFPDQVKEGAGHESN
ncbi:ABC transporter ATP-binding protein [Lentilactobacillus otakiensis]|uniref:Oligopeptide/dipeptide ABC transporter ATPase n=1 Tax=Lentilactobacillus otakiensis DSM 19908 = JCM 15040 TaxID=1423780 RepID=S4NJ48_9LACO|nr:ABC transporter ATP-binding protein [Lentilactobacillus otakiensis]KRL10992.1 oligopeptide dipeptide ABC transporter ATPase [Lentilactobacillus otakiensis DSM 19908 = JCM 15040]MBZ3777226.1 ABC transporter ATP-binding protein [Lentilactobacillus otakiensis]GAD17332.1 oligopeptide/dipeptide ABC transporter ATPase [Lentilactobacillus otakiensis DSM 19908 = JCM 15040]